MTISTADGRLASASASRDRFEVSEWTMAAGLPSNIVRALAHDPDGFLWIGTASGLARFDGSRFRIYDLANSPGLPDARITSLHADRGGELWIGTESGDLCILRDGDFLDLDLDLGGTIYDVVEIADGTLWFACDRGILHASEGSFSWIESIDEPVFDLSVDEAGRPWARGATTLYRIEGSEARPIHSGRAISGALVPGLPGQWVLHDVESLAIVTEASIVVHPIDLALPTSTVIPMLEIEGEWRVHDVEPAGGGGSWLSADSGIFRVDPGSTAIRTGMDAPVRVAPLELTGRVNCVHEDSAGALWLGTETRGLVRLAKPIQFAPSFGRSRDESELVLATSCRWLVERPTAASNPFVVRDIDGTIAQRFHQLPSGPVGEFDIHRAAEGGFWLTHDAGLARYEEGQFEEFPVPPELLPAVDLLETRDRTLWWSSRGRIYHFPDPEPFESRFDILFGQAADGAVWIGNKTEVGRHANGETRVFGRPDGIPPVRIRGFWPQSNGRVWFATYGSGLICIDGERVIICKSENGLPDSFLGGILEDGDGRLWVNSNRGVFVVPIESLDDFVEGRSDFVPSRLVTHEEAGSGWAVHGQDGTLYFEATGRLIGIDPSELTAPPAPPKARVEWIESVDRRYPRTPHLSLPRGDRNVDIQFTAASLHDAGLVRFRYRLSGVDKHWTNVGRRRTARYTRIPPGTHHFEVAAIGASGVWSQENDHLTLHVPAFFSETLWFRVSAGLLLIGLVYVGFFIQTKTRARRIAEVQRESDRRREVEVRLRNLGRRLMETQESERRRIALELHDDVNQRLSLLTVELQLLDQTSDRDLSPLADISSSLSTEVHRLSHALHPARLEQFGLEAGIEGLCREIRNKGDITVSFDSSAIPTNIPFSIAICIYRITQEAIAIGVENDADSIFVELIQRDKSLILETIDDGSQLSPEARIGLASMTERLRVFEGVLEWSFEASEGLRIRATVASNYVAESSVSVDS